MKAHRIIVPLFLLITSKGIVGAQNNVIYLNKSFIEKYEDRALITTSFKVSHAHDRPNTIVKDGDLHAAGIPSKEIGLPTVVEIMNAAEDDATWEMIADGETADITGVWRLWPEHPGQTQSQNEEVVLDPDNTNPNHSFEIHPITSINGHSLITTLGRIEWKDKEYDYKDAATSIGKLEKSKCRLEDEGDGTIGLWFTQIGYNYIHFKAKLVEKPSNKIADGFTVQADLQDLDGNELADGIRLVFVDGSTAADEVWKRKKGDEVTLLAIPRLNLSEIIDRTKNPGAGNKNLSKSLPYELVALGTFE